MCMNRSMNEKYMHACMNKQGTHDTRFCSHCHLKYWYNRLCRGCSTTYIAWLARHNKQRRTILSISCSCMHGIMHVWVICKLHACMGISPRLLEAIRFPWTTNSRPIPWALIPFLGLVPRAGQPQDRQSGAKSAMHPGESWSTPKHATLSH